MAGGRPTKYKKEMLKTITELMKDGASKIEVCATLDISYETLFDWCNSESPRFNKAFSDTIKNGEMISQAWWERKGRVKLEERDFNSTLWFMNVKNRFRNSPVPWSDSKDVKTEHSGTIGLTEALNRAEQDMGTIPAEDTNDKG